MSEKIKELQLNIELLTHAKTKYIETVNNMGNYFSMTKKNKKYVKAKAQKAINAYDKDIEALKEELNKFLAQNIVTDLKKELLETGKLDQNKIEQTVQELGITKIEISPEAQEMKKHQSKVNNIFAKHLNKDKSNG